MFCCVNVPNFEVVRNNSGGEMAQRMIAETGFWFLFNITNLIWSFQGELWQSMFQHTIVCICIPKDKTGFWRYKKSSTLFFTHWEWQKVIITEDLMTCSHTVGANEVELKRGNDFPCHFCLVTKPHKQNVLSLGFIFCVRLSVCASSPSLYGLAWPVCPSPAASCPFPSSSESPREPGPASPSVGSALAPRWCS